MKRAIAFAASLVLAGPGIASAEPYLAGFVGAGFTEKNDVKTNFALTPPGLTLADGTFRDVDFDTSVVFGGKVGYYFDHAILGGNVGFEMEAYHFEPDVGSQNVTFSGMAIGFPREFKTTIQSADIDVTTVGFNLLYRYPLGRSAEFPRGRLQPYIGVGLGIFIASLQTTTTVLDVNKKIDDTDVQPGVQFLAGARYFLTSHIALFAEYKFVHVSEFTFDFRADGTSRGFPVTETARDQAGLSQHQVLGGISFHW